MATELNTKRIGKNTLMLYLRMFVTMIVGFITSRIVLNTLGVEDFGTYNVVGSVVVMFSFISNPLSSSLQRFLNVAMGKGDYIEARKVFNSSFVAYLLLILIIVSLTETAGIWYINNKINIPLDRMDIARYVFQISLLTFCFNLMRGPFEASILAHERMDAYAFFCIFDAIIKLVFVYFLSKAAIDKLLFYAVGICLIALLNSLLYAAYCRCKFTITKISFSYFDRDVFKSVLSFTGWTTYGGLVYTGLTSGINFIINYFFGVIVNAAVGIKNTVSGAIYGFVANFQTAFRPQIFQLYGAGKKDDCFRLVFFASKLSCFLYSFLIFPIFPIIPFLLQIWLGQVPEYSVEFIRVGLLFYLISACDGALWMCVYATGKIKRYQLILNTIELLSIPLIFVLCYMGLPPVTVYYTRIFVELMVFVVRLVYMRKYLEFPVVEYVKKVLLPIVSVVSPLLLSAILLSGLKSSALVSFLLAILQFVLAVILVYLIGLNKVERGKAFDMLKSKFPLLSHK